MGKLTLPPLIRESERWDLTSGLVMPQGQAIVCHYDKCGKNFSEPIELTVWGKGSHETYYACPHCFSRVSASGKSEKRLDEVPLVASKGIEKNGDVNCAHSLGYLKTRPRDSPIPDECLTCSIVLKCM